MKASELKKKFTTLDLELVHDVNGKSYSLPFDMESNGTKRYYGFAGLLALILKDSMILPVDELEASLHPDLYEHFLLSFLMNSKDSQIIATTHNRELLNNKDIFRKDAIWFTDKNEDCATELYSLTDFDSSVVRDTTNVLNAYKSGKLGAKPNTGDYYLDLNS
jgi:AAA15 family ATPase/GTPase